VEAEMVVTRTLASQRFVTGVKRNKTNIMLLLFVFLALQPIVVVFSQPIAGFSLLVFEVS
jgi:hypothetical protein